METKSRTVKEWLESLSTTDTSNEEDSIKMENLLRRIGFPKARVTCGCVYPDGLGQPIDIHTMARTILKSVKGGA